MNAKDMLYASESLLQSEIWGAFRESFGWHAHKVDKTLILERPLPLGRSFLYSPEVIGDPHQLTKLLPDVYAIARRRNALFYRLELLISENHPSTALWRPALRYANFTKSFECVQPDHRQVITLSQKDDDILAQMKPKGRYNIRLAEKAGVRVREATVKTLSQDTALFYTLMLDTAKRDRFAVRPKSYFDTLGDLLYRHNCGRLFIATYQDVPVAAGIITLYNGLASYLYGASSNEYRQVMGPYALQWAAMQWAAASDATHYDLLAIRPPVKDKHHYDGITRFKQQFGGQAVHLIGSYDLVFRPTEYAAFRWLEQRRRRQ